MPRPYKSTHIVHITDTTDRNAVLKVKSAYSRAKGIVGLRYADVDVAPAPNTLDIGIVTSELYTNTQRPDRLIIAVNCAPPDKKGGTTNNHRNDFFCATLKNDAVVCGTSNGFEFSYVQDEITSLYRLTNTNSKGSQFRSLEILPEHTLLFSDIRHRERLISAGILERVEDIGSVVRSAPTSTHVIEVDNFKNVKLAPSIKDLEFLRAHEGKGVVFHFTQTANELAKPKKTRSKVTSISHGAEAVVAATLFAAPTGTNVIALKSSSRLTGDRHVPIIATIRDRPAEVQPNYDEPVLGTNVRFSTKTTTRTALKPR